MKKTKIYCWTLLALLTGCGGKVVVDQAVETDPGAGGTASAIAVTVGVGGSASAGGGDGGSGGAARMCAAEDWATEGSCCIETDDPQERPQTLCAAFYAHTLDCSVSLCGTECVLFQPASWGCWTGFGDCHTEPYPLAEPHDPLIVCEL